MCDSPRGIYCKTIGDIGSDYESRIWQNIVCPIGGSPNAWINRGEFGRVEKARMRLAVPNSIQEILYARQSPQTRVKFDTAIPDPGVPDDETNPGEQLPDDWCLLSPEEVAKKLGPKMAIKKMHEVFREYLTYIHRYSNMWLFTVVLNNA